MNVLSRATVGAFVCLVVLSCCLCQVFYKSCFLWQINDDDDDDDDDENAKLTTKNSKFFDNSNLFTCALLPSASDSTTVGLERNKL